jgi:serine/threonine protein kinase
MLVRWGHVFFLVNILLILDKIGKIVGNGGAAVVYSALLKEKNLEMAVKSYYPIDNNFSIQRDMSTGFELRLKTEYTLNYVDSFIAGEFQCVVMEFMKTSLEKFLSPYINSDPKKYLSDEVCLYLFYLFFCLIGSSYKNNRDYFGVVCSPFQQYSPF